MDQYEVLNDLRIAIHSRIERGAKFRELLLQQLSDLDHDVNTAITTDGRRFVEDLKPQLKELEYLLNTATFEPIHGGRRNFRRYSRRKRR